MSYCPQITCQVDAQWVTLAWYIQQQATQRGTIQEGSVGHLGMTMELLSLRSNPLNRESSTGSQTSQCPQGHADTQGPQGNSGSQLLLSKSGLPHL